MPLRVDVLMHFMESYRPSSTGHLIQRVLPESRQHLFRQERPLDPAAIVAPDREFWILQAAGERLPANARPEGLQVLLLDGTWAQAGGMARAVSRWGRKVSLPMQGESRYWLRTQGWPGRFSTAEALLFLLEALGLAEAHAVLRRQFELHVLANLCARGHKDRAAEFLAGSPAAQAWPDLTRQMVGSRRPPDSDRGGRE